MAAPRPTRRSPRALGPAPGVLAVAALIVLGGCLGTRRPAGPTPGSDLVRAEPALEGAVRRAIQRCDGPTQVGVTGKAREPDRCSRARTDSVRTAPDTVERVQRVP